jgi:serpin B
MANSLWARLGSPIDPEYVRMLATHYGIEPGFLDFAGDPEGSRTAVNDWVSHETDGKIDSLIPSGVISAITRLLIANAVLFKAAWSTPFDPTMTSHLPFSLPTGDEVPVAMMFQIAYLGYGEIGELLAVELPYVGGQTSMVILMPRDPALSVFDVSLSVQQADAQLRGLARQAVALTMPSFGFDSAFRLSRALSALGMAAAFSPSADYTGISREGGIYLSEVLHKAFVSVDEVGTEAGAATAVVMSDAAMPSAELRVKVDRPFLFLIRHTRSGSILFLGRVVDPRQ